MSATETIAPKLIFSNDPTFDQEHFNFQFLRSEGLNHIGKLSGKIWTDFNVHDPGVTILEVLCYALMDLGYRTTLPFEDLLRGGRGKTGAEAYFSPAEILGNNPITIEDYRKLLIDIPGVKNAFIQPAQGANAAVAHPDSAKPLQVNGLYTVSIELDDYEAYCQGDQEAIKVMQAAVQESVTEALHAHRNLCEDFQGDLHFFEKKEVRLKVIAEVAEDADPEKVYLDIFEAVRTYVSPELPFYTLAEMLAAEIPMEEIYAGRPYRPESFGFVKSSELAAAMPRKKLARSDVHSLIQAIPGLVSLQHLEFAFADEASSTAWVLDVNEGFIPILCWKQADISICRAGNVESLDIDQLERQFYLNLQANQRVAYSTPHDALDLAFPLGRPREELDQYLSIQQDFPRNYGIQEGGLAADASPARKAQAYQLKAYLLFFDQLLAGYLAQMTHLPELFSPQADPQRPAAERRTYFSQRVDTVPDLPILLRAESHQLTEYPRESLALLVEEASILAQIEGLEINPFQPLQVEPFFFATDLQRDIAAHSFQRELGQGSYEVFTGREEGGYFFWIKTDYPKLVWLSAKRYADAETAYNSAQSLAFMGSLDENYLPISRPAKDEYSLELTQSIADYLVYFNRLLEDRDTYLQRRHRFLSHLLARFNEDFNAYALQLFGARAIQQPSTSFLNAQANFAQTYDQLSQNRSRAYDLRENGWKSPNISGLEAKVAAIGAFDHSQRSYLCHLEVSQCEDQYRGQVRDEKGLVLFQTTQAYPKRDMAFQALQEAIRALKDPGAYQPDDQADEEQFRLLINSRAGSLISARVFQDQAARDQYLKDLQLQFNPALGEQKQFVFSKVFELQMADARGEVLFKSKNTYKKRPTQQKQWNSFAKLGAKNIWVSALVSPKELALRPIKKGGTAYLDMTPLLPCMLISQGKYRWAWGKSPLASTEVFHDRGSAVAAFLQLITTPPEAWSWNQDGKNLQLVDAKGLSLAQGNFPSIKAAQATQTEAQALLQAAVEGLSILQPVSKAYYWHLKKNQHTFLTAHSLHRDRRRARQDAALSMTAVGPDRIQLQPDKKGIRLIMTNEQGKHIAQSPEIFEVKKAAEAEKAALLSYLESEPKATISEAKKLVGYQLPNLEKGEVSLISLYAYRNTGAAWDAFEEMLAAARKDKSFLNTGDVPNFNLGFSLSNASGELICAHPNTYETPKERTAALTLVKKVARQMRSPLTQRKFHTYQLVINEQVVLASEEEYADIPQAREACEKAMLQAARQQLAEHPVIQENTYQISIEAIPDTWKYEGQLHPVSEAESIPYVSVEAFPSQAESEQAQQAFLSRLSQLTLSRNQQNVIWKTKGRPTEIALTQTDSDKAARQTQQLLKKWLSETTYLLSLSEEESEYAEYLVQLEESQRSGSHRLSLVRKGEALAVHPYQAFSSAEDPKLSSFQYEVNHFPHYLKLCQQGEVWIRLADTYHFVLKSDTGKPTYLISYQGYSSKEGAEEAFQEQYLDLIAWASQVKHYREATETDSFPIPIAGLVMLEGQPLAVIPKPADKRAWDFQALAHLMHSYPIRKWTYFRQEENCAPEPETRYYFRISEESAITWLSSLAYSDPAEAAQDFLFFTQLLAHSRNIRFYELEPKETFYWQHEQFPSDGGFVAPETTQCMGLASVGEVLLESPCNYEDEHVAWKAGSKEFAGAFDQEEPFYPRRLSKGQQGFSFQLVNQAFRLARHPYAYDTAEKAKAALTSLFDSCRATHPSPLSLHIEDESAGYRFQFLNGSDIVWEGHRYYPSLNQCEQAGLRTIDFARDDRFYFLQDGEAQLFDCPATEVNLSTQEPLAIHAGAQAVDQLVEQANSYPFTYRLGAYGFQYHCPTYRSSHLQADAMPCEPKPDASPLTDAPSSSVIGGIVWEQAATFGRLADAQEAHGFFLAQLKQKDSYRHLQPESCGPYFLEIVNPAESVAIHPQVYDDLDDLAAAQARTFSYYHREGLHLVEHILLRPHADTRTSPLPADPQKDCTVRVDGEDYIPLADPYSFWATVVLPCWPQKFLSPLFQEAFQALILEQAPAHVALNILWVPPKELCAFEQVWKKWLRESSQYACGDASVKHALIQCLSSLKEKEQDTLGRDTKAALPATAIYKSLTNELFYLEQPKSSPPPPVLSDQAATSPPAQVRGLTRATKTKKTPAKKAKPPKQKKGKEAKARVSKKSKASLSSAEKDRKIRQRMARYVQSIQAITDENITATEGYQRARLVFSGRGDFQTIAAFVKAFDEADLKKARGKRRQVLAEVMFQVLCFAMDKHLFNGLGEPDIAALDEIMAVIRQRKLDLAVLKKIWQVEELKQLSTPAQYKAFLLRLDA